MTAQCKEIDTIVVMPSKDSMTDVAPHDKDISSQTGIIYNETGLEECGKPEIVRARWTMASFRRWPPELKPGPWDLQRTLRHLENVHHLIELEENTKIYHLSPAMWCLLAPGVLWIALVPEKSNLLPSQFFSRET